MKICLPSVLFAAAAVMLSAQPTTVHLRSGAPAGVELSNCTNATPIVCTSAGAHKLAAGDTIVIENVVGNGNANGVHKVLQAVTATQLSLGDLDGNPVSGSGAWSAGGTAFAAPTAKVAGKALPYQLQAHPRVLLDGPNGKFTRRLRCAVANSCLTAIAVSGGSATATLATGHGIAAGNQVGIWNASNTGLNGTYTVSAATATTISFPTAAPAGAYSNADLTVSRYAFDGNPAWDMLLSTVVTLIPTYTAFNSNISMEKFLAATLVWYTDRSQTLHLTMARHAVLHVEDAIYGTTACDQNANFCGGRTGTDYGRFNAVNAAAIYSILVAENQLSTEERAAFQNKMLNDIDTACVHAPIQTGAGSISVSYNNPIVTGTGTNFLSVIGAGDTIWMPTYGADENVYRVKQVDSDTQLELSLPVGINFSGAFTHARQWIPGDCGIVNILKFHPHGMIGDPVLYPRIGGSQTSFFHNLTLTALWSYVHVGLALADDDARARRLLEGAWLYGYDYTMGYNINSWTGLTQAGGVYHWYRSPWMGADLVFALKNSVIGYPDLLGSAPEWLSGVLKLTYYSFVPHAVVANDSGYGPLFGEGSLGVRGYWLSYQSRVARLFADTDENKAWHWWLKNRFGFTPANLADNQGQGAASYYLGVDPNLAGIDNSTLPTQAIFDKTGYEVCAPLFMRACDSPLKKYSMAVSRTGWTSANDSQLQIYGGTYQPDHFENQAGDYRLVKGEAGVQPCLLGGDAYTCAYANGGQFQMNLLEFGAGASRKDGSLLGNDGISNFTRWKADASGRFVYAMVDLTLAFKTVHAVQRANRHFVHFKKPGTEELVIIYDDAATNTPTGMRAYSHYSQNGIQAGEGSTTCVGGCSTIHTSSGRVISQSLSNGLVTQYHAVHPATRFRLFVDNANGTYTGGNNYSFRLTYCATSNDTTCSSAATGMEAVIVHRLIAGTADTSLTSTALSPSPAWTGVQTADKVALFARQQSLPDRLPLFTTTHAGTAQYLIAGLAAGSYNVFRNGSAVQTNVPVLASDHIIYFEDVAGDYTVVPTAETAQVNVTVANTVALATYIPGTPGACGWELSLDSGFNPLEQTGSDAAAALWREVPLTGLGAQTSHFFRRNCAGQILTGAFSTLGLPAVASRVVSVSVRPPSQLGVTGALLQWGVTPGSLIQQTSASCASGCTLSFTTASNSLVSYRLTYLAGSTAVAATEERRLTVP